MILPRYHVAPSRIPGAGKGVFLDEPVARGRVLTAPDAIPRVWTLDEIAARPDAARLFESSVRWFEDRYTVTPEWPDECFINHSFTPTGLWHFGFVVALDDLPAGAEVTVDYRHLLGPGEDAGFRDAASGEAIIGLAWKESLRRSTTALLELIA